MGGLTGKKCSKLHLHGFVLLRNTLKKKKIEKLEPSKNPSRGSREGHCLREATAQASAT